MNPNRSTRFVVFVVAFCAAAAAVTGQTQLLVNGDLESGAPGAEPGAPYLVETEPGSAVVLNAQVRSPFTNVYPAGNQSVYLTDGGGAFVWPHLRQEFAQQALPAEVQVNFDFLLDGSLAAIDLWSFQIDDAIRNRAPFIAVINGNENAVPNSFSIVGSTTSVPLQGGLWYNVFATMNLNTRSISATLTPFGGSPVSLTAATLDGSFYATHVDIRDLSLGQNQPIYFDNLSVVVPPIPEPSVVALALCALGGYSWSRGRCRHP